jgi:hypothetical protein
MSGVLNLRSSNLLFPSFSTPRQRAVSSELYIYEQPLDEVN